jgi:hypothetical protein
MYPHPAQQLKKKWEPVAHTYNPSYSGGRGQEDRGLKPAREDSLRDPISKKPLYKKMSWGSGST